MSNLEEEYNKCKKSLRVMEERVRIAEMDAKRLAAEMINAKNAKDLLQNQPPPKVNTFFQKVFKKMLPSRIKTAGAVSQVKKKPVVKEPIKKKQVKKEPVKKKPVVKKPIKKKPVVKKPIKKKPVVKEPVKKKTTNVKMCKK